MRANAITQPDLKQAAFDNLQNVILRLAEKQEDRNAKRHEFKSLVEQALDAYRGYMRVIEAK